jgi:hypothetical protein
LIGYSFRLDGHTIVDIAAYEPERVLRVSSGPSARAKDGVEPCLLRSCRVLVGYALDGEHTRLPVCFFALVALHVNHDVVYLNRAVHGDHLRSHLAQELSSNMASSQQSETPVVYVISRFEVPLISYNDYTLNDMLDFTIDMGPPVRWKFAINDLNEQKWTWIVGVTSDLEAAMKRCEAGQQARGIGRRRWRTRTRFACLGVSRGTSRTIGARSMLRDRLR